MDGAWELADTELPDIHAGQVVFASIRAKDNASDINLAGKDAVAWDDAEKVAIAQNEVYQPSFDVSSGLLYSRRRAPLNDSTMNFFESRVTEYQKAPILAPCSDEELVSDIFNLKETKRLTDQVSATIDSAFCTSDAEKLTSIMQDWAKHTDERQVGEALCALLRECERDRDAETLCKVLSDFFLALPDPWKARASSIFAAQSAKSRGGAVSPSPNVPA